jgi:hypothetical protein
MRFALTLVLCLIPTLLAAETRPPAPPADERAGPEHPGWSVAEETGCWIWNPEPGPDDVFHWSGGCDSDRKATGKGRLEWSYGGDQLDRYEGSYRAGRMDGAGTYFWANGKRYEGTWKDGEMHGKGKYFWPDGRRFEGNWVDDRPQGVGEYWTNGQHYLGSWQNGCFRQGDDIFAIGRPIEECEAAFDVMAQPK